MNQFITGDVLTELKKLPAECAQSIIADPPYFNVLEEVAWDTQWKTAEDYILWCEGWVKECLRVMKPDAMLFIFGQPGKREHTFLHLMSRLCRVAAYHDLIIWDRVVGYNERRDSFTPQYEMVLVLTRHGEAKFNKDAVRIPYDEKTIQQYLKDPRYKDKEAREAYLREGKYATNILRIPSLKGASKEKVGHPSQKPEKLIRDLIMSSTDRGDLVIDPFVGSGTTALMAREAGRDWLGIDNAPEYIAMAERRMAGQLDQG